MSAMSRNSDKPKPASGAGRRADADAAGLHWRQWIERHAVLVTGDAGMFQALVGILAGKAKRSQIDEGEVGVGAARHQIGAALLEAIGEGLGVGDHRFGIGLEIGLQRFAEGDCLGGDDMHQRAALQAREDRRIDLLGDGLVIGQHHAAARAAQGLMGGGGDNMGMAEGGGMLARRHQTGEVGHVHEQDGADFVSDLPEACEIEVARIGRSTGNDHFRLMFFRQAFDLVEIDQMVVLAHAILNGIEPLARLGRGGAMSEVGRPQRGSFP
jgi:hypothetical protein